MLPLVTQITLIDAYVYNVFSSSDISDFANNYKCIYMSIEGHNQRYYKNIFAICHNKRNENIIHVYHTTSQFMTRSIIRVIIIQRGFINEKKNDCQVRTKMFLAKYTALKEVHLTLLL